MLRKVWTDVKQTRREMYAQRDNGSEAGDAEANRRTSGIADSEHNQVRRRRESKVRSEAENDDSSNWKTIRE